MGFDPDIAQTGFGYGLSPKVTGPADITDMVALLRAKEPEMPCFPLPSDAEMREKMLALLDARRKISKAEKGSDAHQALQEAFKTARRAAKQEGAKWIGATLARRVWSRDGLRERLVAFWNDHFSAPGKNVIYRYTEAAYVANAIRPHVNGRFEDMLIAAVLHPQMLHFLDQNTSVGPNSTIAKKRSEKNLGLNENLAREILELHTLGVGGGYTQKDVRQLAELLTGVTTIQKKGTAFLAKRAEPGAETVLGKEYGKRRARMADVHAVLRDLARHPDTARHITRKLAVHFVSETPDEDLLVSMGARYLETDGDLAEVMEAMLRHPAAWAAVGPGVGNFKQPELFVSSSLRALAVPKERFRDVKSQELERLLGTPLRMMGQPWRRPFGPDGFEEADSYWLTPQGMAARLQWALGVPAEVLEDLPDPRQFAETTLGPQMPGAVKFAAEAAESRREGIALVLMSPAFQRV